MAQAPGGNIATDRRTCSHSSAVVGRAVWLSGWPSDGVVGSFIGGVIDARYRTCVRHRKKEIGASGGESKHRERLFGVGDPGLNAGNLATGLHEIQLAVRASPDRNELIIRCLE